MNFDRYQYVDLDVINEIADGDSSFIKEIIENYLSTVPASFQELHNAINTIHSDGVVFFAHKLKGSFGFVGAKSLQAMAVEIELNASDFQFLQTRIIDMMALADKVEEELKSVLCTL